MSLLTILLVAALILTLLDIFPIVPAKIPFLSIAVLLLAIVLLMMTEFKL